MQQCKSCSTMSCRSTNLYKTVLHLLQGVTGVDLRVCGSPGSLSRALGLPGCPAVLMSVHVQHTVIDMHATSTSRRSTVRCTVAVNDCHLLSAVSTSQFAANVECHCIVTMTIFIYLYFYKGIWI